MSLSRYTSITSDWTDDSRCTCGRELVLFHYFNPNGLYRAHRSMSETISQYVDDGILTTGWLLAYGSLNSYGTDRLVDMHRLKRVNRISLKVVLEMIQEAVDRGYTKLGEFIMSDEPTAAERRAEAGLPVPLHFR